MSDQCIVKVTLRVPSEAHLASHWYLLLIVDILTYTLIGMDKI